MPSVPGGWGTYATLIAFGVAVSATGYFAMDRQDETAHRAGVAPVAGTASGAGVHGEAAGPPPLPAMAKGAPGEEIIARIEWTVPAAPPARNPGELPGRKPARDVGSGNQGLKPATGDGPMPKSIDARPAGGEAHPASGVDRAAIAVVSTAPAPEVQAPAIRDRWHVLAAALARCEREDVLVAFVCRERARLQYCEGHWGTAPQCPTVALGSNAR